MLPLSVPIQGAVDRLHGEEERRTTMALTRSFQDTVQARAARDPAFKQALLTEGVNALLEGDVAAGKAVLRDYINATVGFESLSAATGTPAKSLMRVFGPGGDPTAGNLFAVSAVCKRRRA
jgi:hypothetical protein